MADNFTHQIQLCYLFLAPVSPGELPSPSPTYRPKLAPYFYDVDIPIYALGQTTTTCDQTEIALQFQIYNRNVLLADCRYWIDFPPDSAAVRQKAAIGNHIKSLLQRQFQVNPQALHEEYLVVLIGGLVKPKAFAKTHLFALARLIRSLEEHITRNDAERFLQGQVAYSKTYRTIVDWEGAVIFSLEDDFESDIALLKIANYQLLRYRVIDQEIEAQLMQLKTKLSASIIGSQFNLRQNLRTQLDLLLNFESVDQQLLLIGDWYTAELYRAVTEEFYLNDWKAIVKNKLDQLKEIGDIQSNNLAVSWSRVIDLIQLVGWALLLIGYFVLFYLDMT